MKRALAVVTALLIVIVSTSALASRDLSKVRSWVCFYGAIFPGGGTPDYDLYVLSSDGHPDLAFIKSRGGIAVGYASFGEINKSDPHFPGLMTEKVLVDKNENWPDAYRVDIRSKKWHDHVIDVLIPRVLAQGFDGIFVDTIDTADYLAKTNKMNGSVKGAIALIKKVRRKYPGMAIVLNNGLFMIDEVGNQIDALVVEDIYTFYDFKKKRYEMTTEEWTSERIKPLKGFQEKFKKPVLSLDYLQAKDKRDIKLVSGKARGDGFIPYISDIDLKEIFFHPGPL